MGVKTVGVGCCGVLWGVVGCEVEEHHLRVHESYNNQTLIAFIPYTILTIRTG